ncbi:MAG TPA: diaminopimelate epimerase [Bryobacterales bacterium]|nr:diaminopimelate epimerase [Bryobacterales bacterium]
MKIPFAKCQAAGNDFLVVEWRALEAAGVSEQDLPDLARAFCDRRTGAGADGLEVLDPPGIESAEADASIRIFNSDGSEAEISGNGTRCVAATLIADGSKATPLRIATVAGVKELTVVERNDQRFVFDMTMGRPVFAAEDIGCRLDTALGVQTATVLNVGNPQCILFVDGFDWDWQSLGRIIESHPRFPAKTNVSFVKPLDRQTIDVRFWERGAGETLSSGTGSTGAAVAAVLLGEAESPVRVVTPAGELMVTWQGEDVLLRGPAEIIARGEYFGFRRAG